MIKNGTFLLILLIGILPSQPLSAQIELSEAVMEKMEQMELDFYQPLEHRFKSLKVVDNAFQSYDFALRQKKDKVDVRYEILPDTGIIAGGFPHIAFTNRTLHLANNIDDEVAGSISILQISEQELSDKYKADWGAIAFFRPKLSFAPFQHCKLVALYREGAGYVYTFYLFNNVKTDLGDEYELLRFRAIE